MLCNEIDWPPPPDWPLTWPRQRRQPTPARAGACEVQVWAARLSVARDTLDRLAATLSLSERERAARLRFERDRARFIAGRGLLRTILSRCLELDPAELEFSYGAYGKPVLAGAFAECGLQFNVAHSQDLALFALTCGGPVGVDVERIRPLAETGELVVRFFSTRECAAFKKVAEEQKTAAFFNLWTRKEAWLKATGEGIGALLKRVEVSFLPGEPARLLGLPAEAQSAARWSLLDLSPGSGFAAALAVAAPEVRLSCWRWEEAPTPNGRTQ
jgi:4'-phosphopantetheinyl transferase